MLLGKLETPAVKVYQTSAFNTTAISAEYMVVSAEKFVIGDDKVGFELRFGNIIMEHNKEKFDIIMRQNVQLTSDELSTWGTDDSILLDIIATKLGTSITEKVAKDFQHTY